jgi:hypothetical protein
MSLPVFSLVRRQDHLRALAALEIDIDHPVFPAIVNCPKCCQNRLHLFDDILTDGLWFYCTNCQTHGNIITFGSIIWKTEIGETINKFVDFGLINAAAGRYNTEDCVRAAEREIAAEEFWAACAGQLWTHDDDITACRLREMGVRHETKAGEGLIGVAYAHQIAELCEAVGRRKWIPLRGKNPSIVFPYYNMPGRLSGFLLYQYGNEFNEKKTFVGVTYHTAAMDAGYFLLNNLLEPSPELFRGKQFIVDDPQWALEAQCAHQMSGLQFGPVVAGYSGGNIKSLGRCWPAMVPTARFFQAATVGPETISQACNARGYVCHVPTNSQANKRKTHQSFLQKLRSIHNSAVSWQTGLESALGQLSDIGAYNFATRLNIPHDKIQAFLEKRPEQFSEEFRSRVLSGLRYRPVTQSQIFRKSSLVERDGKLWTTTGNLVCTAQVIITKVTQFDTGEKIYDGSIRISDECLTFTVPAQQVEKQGLLAFAEKYAATHGRLLTYDRQWNHRSLLAALHMHPPQVEAVSAKLGWDDAANVFRFGAYVLTDTAEIRPVCTPPGRFSVNFAEPGIVVPETVYPFLAVNPQNDFVWATAATIVANIIAPIVRKDPRATAITGPAFDIARKIGAALGCEYEQTDTLYRSGVHAFLKRQIGVHEWPFFIANTFNANLFGTIVNRYYNAHFTAATTRTTAAVSVGYGWQTIRGTDLPSIATNFSCFTQLLPMYIQHCLLNRMRLSVANADLVENVLNDLQDWLGKLCGKTFNAARARQQLFLPEQADESLFTEIGAAIADKKIAVIPRPRRADQPDSYILQRKETWWINKKIVDKLCGRSKNIVPNWLKVVDLLAARSVFIDEEYVHKIPGFVISKNWGDQFLITGAAPEQKEVG